MARNRRWQPKLGTKEINCSSLAIVLAEDGSALLIFGPQVMINVCDRCDHFLPAKLIGEKLWQRKRYAKFQCVAALGGWLACTRPVCRSAKLVWPMAQIARRSGRLQPAMPA